MKAIEKMACKELVELVTDYLEGVLPNRKQTLFEEHLASCAGCQVYLRQIRRVIGAAGKLKEDSLAPGSREKLLQLYRDFYSAKKTAGQRNIRLGIGDDCVSIGDHIGYFWETDRDFEEGVGFLEVGLENGDASVVFGHEQPNQRVLDVLRQRGFDVNRLMETRRLWVLGGDPSAHAMLEKIGSVFQAALAAGARLIRLLGNIGWGRPNWPADDHILEFEARVTEAARQFPCVIVCMYDVRALPGRIILKGGFETHPLTVSEKVCTRTLTMFYSSRS
jgi:hypothetical protein